MNIKGFTLLELLLTLTILALLVSLGGPSFASQVQKTKVKTASLSLLEAMALTRTQAVSANTRTTLKAHGRWEQGWDIFMDSNNNGSHDQGEKLLISHEGVDHVFIRPNQPVKRYISYIGSGESRMEDSGAFQAGTLSICPEASGGGYQLILARGGRVRMQPIATKECLALRQ